jgi:hypothetical protein
MRVTANSYTPKAREYFMSAPAARLLPRLHVDTSFPTRLYTTSLFAALSTCLHHCPAFPFWLAIQLPHRQLHMQVALGQQGLNV